jgi:K+-sensing histidine kinase KdpD
LDRADELLEIFDPFTVGSNTKTPAGGRGIGLALCKKIIEVHNGQIWATQNQDKGVTVAFSLPI